MTRSHIVLTATVTWALAAVALFFAIGTMSVLGVAILAVGLLPPLVYLALSGGPTATIAEVLHDTEQSGPGR
jgi:hypothetical protein